MQNTLVLGMCVAACLWAAGAMAADVLSPSERGSMKIGGYIGERMDECIAQRVLAVNVDQFIVPFRERKETGFGDWRCEYWGKWFTSAALAYRYRPTPEVRAVLDKAVGELLKTQTPDGYIGSYDEKSRRGGWDIWGRKYVLLGLIAYVDQTGDEKALVAARRQADALMNEVGEGKANIADLGYPAWQGLPACSVLEPIVLLYERTKDEKYLAFAKYIVGTWSKPSALTKTGLRLIEDAEAGKPVAKIGAPKAYEQTSCYEGVAELYRATGDAKLLEVCGHVGQSIRNTELTIIGSGSSKELWYDGAATQTEPIAMPMETCVTATWMKYAYQMLRLTGEPIWADELERSLYNALPAAVMPGGGWWSYFTGLSGERVPSHNQHEEQYRMSCCVASGPRALMLTPAWAVMSGSEGPVVNFYGPMTAEVTVKEEKVRLVQETEYPRGNTITMRIEAGRPLAFVLSLRIPKWSEKTELSVNGEEAKAEAGTYARMARTWKSGDVVTLKLDLRGRAIGAPGGKKQVAIVRGPVVLAIDNRLAAAKAGDAITFAERPEMTPVDAPKGVWMALEVAATTAAGKPATIRMCDFASAGNEWTEQNRFRTWLPQPLDPATMYDSGVDWKLLVHTKFRPTQPK